MKMGMRMVGAVLVMGRMRALATKVGFSSMQELVDEVVKQTKDGWTRGPLRAYASGELVESVSGKVTKKGRKGEVLVGAKHGLFVELGTVKMQARPSLTQAMENVREKKMVKIVGNDVMSVAKAAGCKIL